MKSEFRILWFEDEPQWLNMMAQQISGFLEKRCLTLKVEVGEIESHQLNNELSNSSYELVLMDFQLSSDSSKPHGNDIIRQIRDKKVTTDVLFYSSNYDGMIANAIESSILDGVYFSNRRREDFLPKIDSVIDKIVAQSENIVNLRGFVLDSCSHYETEFTTQIQKRISDLPLNRCACFREHLAALVDSSIERKQQKWETVQRRGSDINEDTDQSSSLKALAEVYNKSEKELLIDMQMRTQILEYCYSEELLGEAYEPEGEEKIRQLCQYYQDEISIYRNRLAHVEEGQDSINIRGKAITINTELHERLRSSISEFGNMWDECFPGE